MKKVKLFLKESNAIEGVYDKQSLEDAEKAWKYLLKFDKITTKELLKTHKILMTSQPLAGYGGILREVPVWIGDDIGKPAIAVPLFINEWIKKANRLGREKEDHIQFEKIHPFMDGNGRIGRILLNWQRVKKGKSVLVIFEREKEKYYDWFK